ncbi:MAG TPA: hypothetical protein VIV12_13175 [Streptosporangiaceae bacterium]
MAELDKLLTEALHDLAAEAPQLPPLSPRARRRIRAGRAGTILASVVVVAGLVAGLVIGALALNRAALSQPPNSPRPHPAWAINTSGGVDAMAVGTSMLYVATGDLPDATLSAYSRTTGQLIHRIRVPARPVALRVGPGGSVWLTFYPDQNGGGTGLWLLSPDLGQRSSLNPRAARSIGLSDLLPVGTADALVAAEGLADLHMPVPGHHGHATFHQVSAMPADHGYGGAVIFARLAGRVAVLQENKIQDYRIVVAGPHGPVFDPGPGVNINSMAGGGNGLWITTGSQPTGPSTGAVIRLNDRLQTVTPHSISKNPAFAFPAQIWTTGDTVVATTDSSSQPLVCFRFHNGAGPVTDIPARLPPGDVAVTGDTVYAADASGVIVYRLPAACR